MCITRWSIFKLVLIGYAMLLGITASEEKWLYLAVLATIPCAVLWPIQASLGAFAFLLPFDTVAVLGSGVGEDPGSTLNWYVGAAAGLMLLAAAIVGGRFERPPRAALWWSLLMLWA